MSSLQTGGAAEEEGAAAPRSIVGEPLHTRCLSVAIALDEPGRLRFRGDVIDLRKAGLMSLAGRIAGAGIIHKMSVSGSFDAVSGCIETIEWEQSHVMHEANGATRGECCRDPMGRLSELVGTPLGGGFRAALKGCFGGPLGCTHVNTLLQEVDASVTVLFGRIEERPHFLAERVPGDRVASRNISFDAVRSAASPSVELSVGLSDLYFAPCGGGAEVLDGHEEVRLTASVELAGWQLQQLHGVERSRAGPACGDAEWESRDAALAAFSGRSLGGGMARAVLERFGGSAEQARLRSALLALGPGMTQVGAALSDGLVPSESAGPLGGGLAGPGPCYMLRAGGPLMETLVGQPASGEGEDSVGSSRGE